MSKTQSETQSTVSDLESTGTLVDRGPHCGSLVLSIINSVSITATLVGLVREKKHSELDILLLSETESAI